MVLHQEKETPQMWQYCHHPTIHGNRATTEATGLQHLKFSTEMTIFIKKNVNSHGQYCFVFVKYDNNKLKKIHLCFVDRKRVAILLKSESERCKVHVASLYSGINQQTNKHQNPYISQTKSFAERFIRITAKRTNYRMINVIQMIVQYFCQIIEVL